MKRKAKLVFSVCSLLIAISLMTFGIFAAVTAASVQLNISITYTAAAYVKADVLVQQGATGLQTPIPANGTLESIGKTTLQASKDKTINYSPSLVYDGTSSQMKYFITVIVKNTETGGENPNLYVSLQSLMALSNTNIQRGHVLTESYTNILIEDLSAYQNGATPLPAVSGTLAPFTPNTEITLGAGQTVRIVLNVDINRAQSLATENVSLKVLLNKTPIKTTIADSSQWTVNSSGVITQYKGSSNIVDVPSLASDGVTPITSINYGVFSGKNIKVLNIPDGVVCNCDFAGDTNIEYVILGQGQEVIGAGMFSGCSNLKYIKIPNTVTSIIYRAFQYCSSLSSIEIPNSVQLIDTESFYGTGLTSVTIPASVTEIRDFAFSTQTLQEVVFNESENDLYLGGGVFGSNCTIDMLKRMPSYSSTSNYIYSSAKYYNMFFDINVSPLSYTNKWVFDFGIYIPA